MLSTDAGDFTRYVIDRSAEGIVRLDRSVYTDPDLFELELKCIFAGTWVYLAHESQIPKPHDFLTAHIGRQPVIVNRDEKGAIGCFINACAHRGALLCRTRHGNNRVFTCTYHGWAYDSSGRNLYVERQSEGYPPSFDRSAVNLTRLPKVGSYRGFIFASLNPDVAPLEEHLGGAAPALDLLIDQSPDGVEILPGTATCTYDGNWKLLLENGGGDGLHPNYTHKTISQIIRRKQGDRGQVQSLAIDRMAEKPGGQYGLGHGHTFLWSDFPNPEARPIYQRRAELERRFGPARTDWMTTKFRNLSIFPNVQILDQMATLVRYFRPLAVDKTEVTFWCIAPIGEDAEDREHRLRQFEEFFSAAGMGAPDDNAQFEACQRGAYGAFAPYSEISFGIHSRKVGSDPRLQPTAIRTEHGGIWGYEGCSLEQYTEWMRLLSQANAQPLGGCEES
jgi:benzoate/toluate 1,2-dioxygenase alpha subunit